MLYSLARIGKLRAQAQAAASTETKEAVVLRTYTNKLGFVNECDVQVKGQQKVLKTVANVAPNNWGEGDIVVVNFVKGSPWKYQITGAAGATTTSSLQANNAAAIAAANAQPVSIKQQLSGVPFLLEDTTDQVGGFVLEAGANVVLTVLPESTASGGRVVPGKEIVTAIPLVATSLPDPATSGLPDRTCLDLIDSYRNPRGMYRLNLAALEWERRDVGIPGGVASLTLTTSDVFLGVTGQTVFTLRHSPLMGSLRCYVNGLRETRVSISGNRATVAYPVPGPPGTVVFDYAYGAATALFATDAFLGTSGQTVYALSNRPDVGAVRCSVGGARETAFTVSGGAATLGYVPYPGVDVVFDYTYAGLGTTFTTNAFTGSPGQTAFDLTHTPSTTDIQGFVNGARETDLSIGGNRVTIGYVPDDPRLVVFDFFFT